MSRFLTRPAGILLRHSRPGMLGSLTRAPLYMPKHLLPQSYFSSVRSFSSASSSSSGGEQPGAEAGAQDGHGGAYQEPIVIRISRFVWNTIKLALGTAIVSGVLYAGYTIFTVLVPIGASSNAILRKATEALKHDPDVHGYYGDIKTYGIDLGGRAEGRRYFVPEYKYEDPYTGTKYHRVKFTLEGDRSRKASVFAEVSESTGEFRYLIVVAKDGSRVFSIIDRRPPLMSLEDRQARVSTFLQDSAWTFYADNDVDVQQQSSVLGDYWLKVKCIRCDQNPSRCEEVGMLGNTPSWLTFPVGSGATLIGSALAKIGVGNAYIGGPVKGVKELAELEDMIRPLAADKEAKEAELVGSGKKLSM